MRTLIKNEKRLIKIITVLKKKYEIITEPPSMKGNVCKTISHAYCGKIPLVIKIGLEKREKEEVQKNWIGYKKMKEIGAADILPEPLKYYEILKTPILVMGNCGQDFYHLAKRVKQPVNLYRRLVKDIKVIHQKTATSKFSAIESIELLKKMLLQLYKKYLVDLIDSTLIKQLQDMAWEELLPRRICFSRFDFTPENIFLTPQGLKYVDPREDVLGIPIIDLAIFAGLARDVYFLPGAKLGYKIFYNYACQELSNILGLSPKKAYRFFMFGRAFQSAMSARFRLQSNPTLSRYFADESQRFLRKFLNPSQERRK